MANSFQQRGFNGVMAFSDSTGSSSAFVRIKSLSYNYGVTSTESHARAIRGFYPHRRAAGQFSLTIDCIGYKEFKQLMGWLQSYTEAILNDADTNSSNVTLMAVRLDSRNFNKVGILTTGIDDHDHVGAMVYSPELVFVTVSDPADPMISLINPQSSAFFTPARVNAADSTAYYPSSTANYKDAAIYNDPSATTAGVLATMTVQANLATTKDQYIPIVISTVPDPNASQSQYNPVSTIPDVPASQSQQTK